MNYAKLLEISSFFTWHIFLKVGKTQDMPNKIWQILGDTLQSSFVYAKELACPALGGGRAWDVRRGGIEWVIEWFIPLWSKEDEQVGRCPRAHVTPWLQLAWPIINSILSTICVLETPRALCFSYVFINCGSVSSAFHLPGYLISTIPLLAPQR